MKKIYINPGHSDIDPGAVGFATERALNVAVAGFVQGYLQQRYLCQTRMNPGSMDSLAQICADANTWGADLFLSIHFNAGGGDGYEALVYGSNRIGLGQVFEKHVLAAGQNSRGVKLRPDLYVLRNTAMPAILNEGAFVDNLKDITDWNDSPELMALGVAYAEAAAEALKLEAKNGYSLEQFIREVQSSTGSAVDGIAGPQTIGNTVTVSSMKNSRHPVVVAIQKRLSALGYGVVGEADGVAGTKFEAAVVAFQEDNGCWQDGELTAGNKTWKKMLGMA